MIEKQNTAVTRLRGERKARQNTKKNACTYHKNRSKAKNSFYAWPNLWRHAVFEIAIRVQSM